MPCACHLFSQSQSIINCEFLKCKEMKTIKENWMNYVMLFIIFLIIVTVLAWKACS
jgi:hypothetical protein